MLLRLLFFIGSLILPALSLAAPSAPNVFLQPVNELNLGQRLLSDQQLFEQKDQILSRTLKTIEYLGSPEAEKFYANYFAGQFSAKRVRESLLKFYLILSFSSNVEMLSARLEENFAAYKSVGQDGQGSVLFTGYFQPIYKASRQRTAEYRYPIFRKPADFDTWQQPHPTRVFLEGFDGLGQGTFLEGQELAWLASRYDVFMVQVQGSAILQFADGEQLSVGYAAGTNYSFSGISANFLREHKVAWHKLGGFFAARPDLLNEIMAKNNRFIFFEEKPSVHAIGSLGVPVLSERTIATDRLKLPPGAVALIETELPVRNQAGKIELRKSSRLVLNLDTGSAIKGPGRVDLFMGSGEDAKERASAIFNRGELYYLFLR